MKTHQNWNDWDENQRQKYVDTLKRTYPKEHPYSAYQNKASQNSYPYSTSTAPVKVPSDLLSALGQDPNVDLYVAPVITESEKKQMTAYHRFAFEHQINRRMLMGELGCFPQVFETTSTIEELLSSLSLFPKMKKLMDNVVINHEGAFFKAKGDVKKGYVQVVYNRGKDLYEVSSLVVKKEKLVSLEKVEEVYAEDLNTEIYRQFTRHYCYCGEQSGRW